MRKPVVQSRLSQVEFSGYIEKCSIAFDLPVMLVRRIDLPSPVFLMKKANDRQQSSSSKRSHRKVTTKTDTRVGYGRVLV